MISLFPKGGAGTALARLAPEPKRLVEPYTAKVQTPKLETKSLPVLSYPIELFFGMQRANADATTARAAMAAYALCYSCLRYRATKLTEPPVWIIDENDDGETWLKGEHELSTLLETPNPDMEMQEFLDLVSLYLDTSGACLIVKNMDRGGRTATMYPFARHDFTVEQVGDRVYGRFQIRTAKGNEWKYPDEVIYLRNTDPQNLHSVLSPTDVALSHINLGRSMVAAIKSALRNAVRPGGIVTVEGDLTDDAYRRLGEEIKTNYAGVYNTGATILLEGGATYEAAKGASLKEMSLGPLQEDVESAICSAYQVHPVLVQGKLGIQSSSGMSDSIKPLQDLFYDTVILPRWGYIERAFTRHLLRPVDPRPRRFIRFDTTKVRGLQVDLTARVLEAAGAATFWLKDEQRAHTMRPPLTPAQRKQLAEEQAPAVTEEGQQASRRASTARDDAGQKSDTLEAKVATVFLGHNHVAPELITRAWEAFDIKAASQEAPYETAARAQFAAEETAIVRLLESAVPGTKGISDTLVWPYLEAAALKIAAAYAAGGLFYQQWVKRYRPLIAKSMGGAAEDLVDQVGIELAPNVRFQGAIQRRVTKLAGNVTDTTLQSVRDVIAKARTEGVTVRELAKRIRTDAFADTITKARATTIARTETVGALNEGEMVAAQSSGVFRAKKWIDQRTGSDRARHIAEEDAGWVAIDAPYTVTGKMYPHDGVGGAAEDVNCRCSQLFTDLTADEANREAT